MLSRKDIAYVVATQADRELIRKALATFFYPEEPLTMAHRDGADVTPDDMENSLSFLDRGTIILARLSGENGPTGTVVGISIGGPSDGAVNVPVRTAKFSDIVAFLEMAYARASVNALGSRPSYNIHVLAVHSSYRGLSIGRRLVEEQIALAKKRWSALHSVTSDATGPASTRLMKQLGMVEIGQIRFDEYRDELGTPIFGKLSGAKVVTLEKQI